MTCHRIKIVSIKEKILLFFKEKIVCSYYTALRFSSLIHINWKFLTVYTCFGLLAFYKRVQMDEELPMHGHKNHESCAYSIKIHVALEYRTVNPNPVGFLKSINYTWYLKYL